MRADACGSSEGKQAKVRMGEAAMEVGVKRAHSHDHHQSPSARVCRHADMKRNEGNARKWTTEDHQPAAPALSTLLRESQTS